MPFIESTVMLELDEYVKLILIYVQLYTKPMRLFEVAKSFIHRIIPAMTKFVLPLTCILLLLCSNLKGQIFTGNGVWPEDSCTFEQGVDVIVLDTSSANVWQIGQPSKTLFNAAFSPDKAIMTDTLNAIPINTNSFFEVKYTVDEFGFIPYSFMISFRHRYNTDTLTDGGFVSISFDNRQSWENIIVTGSSPSWALYPNDFSENLYSTSDTLFNGELGFSGNSNGWVESKFQYGIFPVKWYGDTVIVRFNYISDSIADVAEGWMVDDIVLNFVDLGGEVHEFERPDGFTVYPNPASNYISVFPEDFRRPLTFQIYSIIGELMLTKKLMLERETINLDGLPNGNYIVRLVGYNEVSSKKLIISDH